MARVAPLMLLLAACSTDKPPIQNAVIAIGTDPGHFNPGITTAAHIHTVADSIFNGLVALDEHANPVPDLATSWEVEDDGRVYVFHLAHDVSWHDGRPFTSRDVVFTFEEILLRFHSRTRAGLSSVLEGIEAPDDHTVVFRFRQPYAPLLQRLDVTEAPILPAHVFAGGDIERHPANLSPIGTGPFQLDTYERDDRIVLRRNESYFKPELPRLDELVFRVIPEPNTQLLALERGEVDYVGSVRLSDARRLRDSGAFTVVGSTSGPGGGNCVLTWVFNLEDDRLADVQVRRALAHAIDRERIVERVLFGEAKVPDAPVSSAIPWAHADGLLRPYEYDPERARKLLERAGWEDPSLDIVHFPSFIKYGEILRQQLARVGVELQIRSLDRAAAVAAIYDQRSFDTALISYCQGLDPDIGVRRMYDSASIGPVPFSNGAAYRNARVDELFEEAATHYEREARSARYREIQELVARELPYWWLVETRGLTAFATDLRGFSPWSGQFAERAQFVSAQ